MEDGGSSFSLALIFSNVRGIDWLIGEVVRKEFLAPTSYCIKGKLDNNGPTALLL